MCKKNSYIDLLMYCGSLIFCIGGMLIIGIFNNLASQIIGIVCLVIGVVLCVIVAINADKQKEDKKLE